MTWVCVLRSSGTNLVVSDEATSAARETLGPVGETAPEAEVLTTMAQMRRGARHRRVGVWALTAFVLVGFSGYLGVKSTTADATAGGVELRVQHGRVTRPGLATPLQIEVRRDGGFDQPVLVALTHEYLQLYDFNQTTPSPAEEWTDGDLVVWQFEPPEGDELRVRLDGRIEPARSAPASATVAVLDDGGERIVDLDIDTLVLP